MKERYGAKIHETIGRKGGKISRGGGFAYGTKQFASEMGKIGGKMSKRGSGRRGASLMNGQTARQAE